MSNPTGSRASRKDLGKPNKPDAGFLLATHAGGKRMKKIRGTGDHPGAWGRRYVEGDGSRGLFRQRVETGQGDDHA